MNSSGHFACVVSWLTVRTVAYGVDGYVLPRHAAGGVGAEHGHVRGLRRGPPKSAYFVDGILHCVFSKA